MDADKRKTDSLIAAAKHATAMGALLVMTGSVAFFMIGSLVSSIRANDRIDAVPFGKQMVRVYDRAKLALGGDRIGDVYVVGDRMLRYHANYDMEAVAASAAQINAYAAQVDVPVYWMAVPTAAGIYADTLPTGAPQADELQMLRDMEGLLDAKVSKIDCVQRLYASRDAEIYYRTDTRWKTYGAYLAYRTAIRRLGFPHVGFDRFRVYHVSDSYYGNLVQETGYFGLEPDLLDLYDYDAGQIEIQVTAWDETGATTLDSCYSLDACEQPEQADAVFAAVRYPVLQIETSVHSNSHLLLITDEFGGNFVPFFSLHYRKATVVNLAQADRIDLQPYLTADAQQILIVCSADTIADGVTLHALNGSSRD